MATAEPPIVTSVWIDAAPDRVFPFFTDPARLTRWLGQAADVDPVPGGRFAVDVNDRLVRGSYLEVEPPHRVVFSGATPARPSSRPGAAASRSTWRPLRAGPPSSCATTASAGSSTPTTPAAGSVVLGRLVAAAPVVPG